MDRQFTVSAAQVLISTGFDFFANCARPELHLRRLRAIAAADEDVAERQVAEHLGEQVVEVAAAADAIDKRRVGLLGVGEIEAVRARVVEKVALDPPRLVVHLLPLEPRVDPHFHVGELQRHGRLRRLDEREQFPIVVLANQQLQLRNDALSSENANLRRETRVARELVVDRGHASNRS